MAPRRLAKKKNVLPHQLAGALLPPLSSPETAPLTAKTIDWTSAAVPREMSIFLLLLKRLMPPFEGRRLSPV
jgi:hypothetical protein